MYLLSLCFRSTLFFEEVPHVPRHQHRQVEAGLRDRNFYWKLHDGDIFGKGRVRSYHRGQHVRQLEGLPPQRVLEEAVRGNGDGEHSLASLEPDDDIGFPDLFRKLLEVLPLVFREAGERECLLLAHLQLEAPAPVPLGQQDAVWQLGWREGSNSRLPCEI